MTDIAPSASCATCGTSRMGPWCHAFGQASPDAPRSFREVFTGQTGKVVYTVFRAYTAERRKGKPWIVHGATAIHYMCFSFLISTVLFGAFRLVHGGLTA